MGLLKAGVLLVLLASLSACGANQGWTYWNSYRDYYPAGTPFTESARSSHAYRDNLEIKVYSKVIDKTHDGMVNVLRKDECQDKYCSALKGVKNYVHTRETAYMLDCESREYQVLKKAWYDDQAMLLAELATEEGSDWYAFDVGNDKMRESVFMADICESLYGDT